MDSPLHEDDFSREGFLEEKSMHNARKSDAKEHIRAENEMEIEEQADGEIMEIEGDCILLKKGDEIKATAQGVPGTDGPFWAYPEQFELKNFKGDTADTRGKVLKGFRGLFETYAQACSLGPDSLPVRCFTQVNESEKDNLKALQACGWQETQLVLRMKTEAKNNVFHGNNASYLSESAHYYVQKAVNFEEIQDLFMSLHEFNASLNKRFTLSKNAMEEFKKVYENAQGLWLVLKDKEAGGTKGLAVLIGDKEDLEIEAFIISEEARAQARRERIQPQDRISTLFLKEALRVAENLGVNKDTHIFLYVTAQNEKAKRFYNHFGFEVERHILDCAHVAE